MRPLEPRTPTPQITWSWRESGGRRRLGRHFSLHFELHRHAGLSGMELRIHTDRRVYRWELPESVFDPTTAAERRMATELEALSSGEVDALVPPWDNGRCELSAGITSLHQFRGAYSSGRLCLSLRGHRVWGEYALERTAMAVEGWPQWRVRSSPLAPGRPWEIA